VLGSRSGFGCFDEARKEIGHSGFTRTMKAIQDDAVDAVIGKRQRAIQNAFKLVSAGG
jgi:hypothetical protein